MTGDERDRLTLVREVLRLRDLVRRMARALEDNGCTDPECSTPCALDALLAEAREAAK